MRFIFIALITAYQKTLSPDHGWFRARWPHGFCKFYPSCSEYAKEAIKLHGVGKGIFLSARRIGKCNPWSDPGVDPVPAVSA